MCDMMLLNRRSQHVSLTSPALLKSHSIHLERRALCHSMKQLLTTQPLCNLSLCISFTRAVHSAGHGQKMVALNYVIVSAVFRISNFAQSCWWARIKYWPMRDSKDVFCRRTNLHVHRVGIECWSPVLLSLYGLRAAMLRSKTELLASSRAGPVRS